MSKIVLRVAAALVLASAGFAIATASNATQRRPRIEYRVIAIGDEATPADLQASWNALGSTGWALVAVDGSAGIAVFRR